MFIFERFSAKIAVKFCGQVFVLVQIITGKLNEQTHQQINIQKNEFF